MFVADVAMSMTKADCISWYYRHPGRGSASTPPDRLCTRILVFSLPLNPCAMMAVFRSRWTTGRKSEQRADALRRSPCRTPSPQGVQVFGGR